MVWWMMMPLLFLLYINLKIFMYHLFIFFFIWKEFLLAFRIYIVYIRAVGKGGARGGGGRQPNHHFLDQIFFFHVKSENRKFLHVKNIMRLEFVYWTKHKWQKVDSFFWIRRFSSKLSYHQQPTTSLWDYVFNKNFCKNK